MAEIPQVMGAFSALSRQVLRMDVDESQVSVCRSVHVPSLHEARLGFDDQVRQGYDSKSFDSRTVPVETMAVARSVVSFDPEFKETPVFDPSPHLRGGAYHSTTGQHQWWPRQGDAGGSFQIDTPGTQTAVGFVGGRRFDLGDVAIQPRTDFAAICVTAASPKDTLAGDDRLVLVTMARARNTGMKYRNGAMLRAGETPIRLEPVSATITLKRAEGATVHVLDHNGGRTGAVIPLQGGSVILDGTKTGTCYYEISYGD